MTMKSKLKRITTGKSCPSSNYKNMVRRETICICCVALLIGITCVQVFILHPEVSGFDDYIYSRVSFVEKTSKHPVLVDWHNHFGLEESELRTCRLKNRKYDCVLTRDRSYTVTNITQAILFYGSDVTVEELPLPRKSNHIWSLMHEESPKNNVIFSFKGIMELFNYTSTFRRESNLPLTTQYLRSIEQLESTKYLTTFEEKTSLADKKGLAPVIYVQSDCATPSDRDNIVKLMMKYIKVDSYGLCLHNKKLPEHLRDPVEGMRHEDFLKLVSQYKFAVAMENALCSDYLTEKLWRPLVVGTIPIFLGSALVDEFTPNNRSILDLTKYTSIKQLTSDIERIAADKKEYESYRSFKRTGGVTNKFLAQVLASREWEPDIDVEINLYKSKPNFPTLYACKVCEMMHNIDKRGMTYQATVDHYGCPWPTEFSDEQNLQKKAPFSNMWHAIWSQTASKVQAFLELSNGGHAKPSAAKLETRYQQLMHSKLGL